MANKYRSKNKIIADMKMKKLLETMNTKLSDINYDGRTVKLNQEKYEDRFKKGMSEAFKEWYYENKDREFEAKTYTSPYMNGYELKGVSPWTFNPYDFFTPCDECGEYIDMNLYYCKHCGKEYFEDVVE